MHSFSSYQQLFALDLISVLVALDLREEASKVDALGALDGETQSSVPDKLGEGS